MRWSLWSAHRQWATPSWSLSTKATDAGDAFVVTVTLAGVDDPDGLEGFTLVGVDLAVKPSSVVNPGSCTGFTVAPVECTLTFPNTGFPTDDRLLLLQRADDRVRWKLV